MFRILLIAVMVIISALSACGNNNPGEMVNADQIAKIIRNHAEKNQVLVFAGVSGVKTISMCSDVVKLVPDFASIVTVVDDDSMIEIKGESELYCVVEYKGTSAKVHLEGVNI